MERANHINIVMRDRIDSNGSAGSKVAAAEDRSRQPLGSTVSFHNIQYKVQLRSGIFGKEKSSGKEILTDLKLVKCFHLIKNPDCWWIVGLFSTFPMEKKRIISHKFLCLFLPRG